jgi:triosephosphate isomerase (TIM)
MFFINFKTYEQGTGKGALNLLTEISKVAENTGITIILVLQATDIKEAVEMYSGEVWAQHVDPVKFGANTGSILPEAVKEDGAAGTFLNHSEKKFENFESLVNAHSRAKEIGLKTLVFADGIEELEKITGNLVPDYVSYEPPELVGNSEVSVSTAHPDVIKEAKRISSEKNIPLIVGAGIHSSDDVRIALELGANGFAVASDVVKAQDPKSELEDLISGYQK